jgi:uncharacterized protein YceK
MVKKSFLLFVLLIFVFLGSGCSTVVKGTVGATNGLVQGTKEGAKQDWESIKKTDAWMKDNLW